MAYFSLRRCFFIYACCWCCCYCCFLYDFSIAQTSSKKQKNRTPEQIRYTIITSPGCRKFPFITLPLDHTHTPHSTRSNDDLWANCASTFVTRTPNNSFASEKLTEWRKKDKKKLLKNKTVSRTLYAHGNPTTVRIYFFRLFCCYLCPLQPKIQQIIWLFLPKIIFKKKKLLVDDVGWIRVEKKIFGCVCRQNNLHAYWMLVHLEIEFHIQKHTRKQEQKKTKNKTK